MADYNSNYTGAQIDANLALAATAVQPNSSPTFGTTTTTGNLVFSGLGQRILGPFTETTHANRPMFQTSTVNSNTTVGILPNGSGVSAGLTVYGTSDPANAPAAILVCSATAATLQTRAFGTGTAVPLTFRQGTTDRGALDTNGNFLFGATTTTDTVTKLQVTGITKQTVYTVATLPTGSNGCRSQVSDANATTFGSIVAGGGANNVPVYHDGTNWRIG